jgi:hypothetical protein
MLVNSLGKWFTTNAYNFSCYSPLHKSLHDIDENIKRREIIKKHFTVEMNKHSPCCFLYYHGIYVSAWLRGNKFAARWTLQAAVNMYIVMGGK